MLMTDWFAINVILILFSVQVNRKNAGNVKLVIVKNVLVMILYTANNANLDISNQHRIQVNVKLVFLNVSS